ncbi:MAG: hypothetical protein KKB03_04310 [Nanoarchaeota archaeon]|nr:hypothetical protein [Nanoarchaeota archaeon]MBU1135627.1 hypothetical protein [Nanoarchaeota archaeon]MBU2520437.1 hypothetical protein [Nanoarchaeota archaeon]
MKKLVIFAFVALLVLPLIVPAATALDAKDYQKTMSFSLVRGQSLTMPLIIENNEDVDVTNIEFTSTSSWVTFNGGNSYTIPAIYPDSDYILQMQITVPNDASLSSYIIDVTASGTLFTKINLDVSVASNVAINFEETIDNLIVITDDMTGLEGRIKTLESEMNSLGSEVNSLGEDLGEKIENKIGEFAENEELVSQIQSEKGQLQDEVKSLKNQMTEEKEQAEMTGMMIANSSATLGIIIAIIVVSLLARKGIFKRLKTRKTTEKEREEFKSKRPRDFAPKH